MFYKKKPVVIEAIQVRFPGGNKDDLVHDEPRPLWLDDAIFSRVVFFDHSCDEWKIGTLEGDHIVSDGDYIIKGVKGELYPCKPDIFEEAYEVVRDA